MWYCLIWRYSARSGKIPHQNERGPRLWANCHIVASPQWVAASCCSWSWSRCETRTHREEVPWHLLRGTRGEGEIPPSHGSPSVPEFRLVPLQIGKVIYMSHGILSLKQLSFYIALLKTSGSPKRFTSHSLLLHCKRRCANWF